METVFLGDDENFWNKIEVVVYAVVNVPSATELYSLKWLILCEFHLSKIKLGYDNHKRNKTKILKEIQQSERSDSLDMRRRVQDRFQKGA